MVLSSCASCSVSCACGGECWCVGITGECWRVGITGGSWHVGITELCLLLSTSSGQYTCMDTALGFFLICLFLFYFFIF